MKWSHLGCLGLVVLTGSACRQSRGQTEASATAAAGPTRSENSVRFDAASPQLERIHVAPATAAMLPVDEFEVPGKVEPLPTRLAKVALPLSGRVRQVLVTLGDHVRSAQTLMTVETPESSTLQSALRQANADVTHRHAAVAKAEADLSRARDLLANRAIAQKDVVTAEAALAEVNAALEQARAIEDDVNRRLRLLGVDVQRQEGLITVRSPMAGEVVDITVAPGEYRSDTAAPVMTVADLSRVWVVAAVPETGLAQVQSNQRVTIVLSAYPEQEFEGRVTRVAGALDPDTRTAKIIAELSNPRGQFKPQMFARVRYTGPARAVVTIPIGAVIHDERRTTVFVEQARGHFERRDVSLGPRHGTTVVVTKGLTAGDRVVIDGTMLLMGQ